jgi:hypothetical protein
MDNTGHDALVPAQLQPQGKVSISGYQATAAVSLDEGWYYVDTAPCDGVD